MLRCAMWINVLYAHGTISQLSDLSAFLTEIRRGRVAPPELLAEMRHRYEAIGHSPLLEHTRAQATTLQELGGRETRVAMRLWDPRLRDVIADLDEQCGVCLIPMAPYSVDVYRGAAERELQGIPELRRPRLVCVEPWGTHPALIGAYVAGIERSIQTQLPDHDSMKTRVILTAHSLPAVALQHGDPYEQLFLAAARLIASKLSVPVAWCFQSQGADGGGWLGPTLSSLLEASAREGFKQVVVAPIGFFAEHVETLYDLDIEAKHQARSLDLGFVRVPTLGRDVGLMQTLHDVSEAAIAKQITAG